MKKELKIYLYLQGIIILIILIIFSYDNYYRHKIKKEKNITYPLTQESLTLNKDLLKLVKIQQIVIKEQAELIKAYEEALNIINEPHDKGE